MGTEELLGTIRWSSGVSTKEYTADTLTNDCSHMFILLTYICLTRTYLSHSHTLILLLHIYILVHFQFTSIGLYYPYISHTCHICYPHRYILSVHVYLTHKWSFRLYVYLIFLETKDKVFKPKHRLPEKGR